MKKLTFTLFLSALFAVAVQAQSIFTLSNNPVSGTAPIEDDDFDMDVYILNNTSAAQSIKWERIVISNPDNIATQVCDKLNCYFPQVSSKIFPMTPNDQDTLKVHFLNATGGAVSCVVHLKVSDNNNPGDFQTAVYNFTAETVGTNDPQVAQFKVFPNPTTEGFFIENDLNIAQVSIIGYDGRLQSSFSATPGMRYSIVELPAGAYIAVMQDASGRVVGSAPIEKR
jgi:hypothetical protein